MIGHSVGGWNDPKPATIVKKSVKLGTLSASSTTEAMHTLSKVFWIVSFYDDPKGSVSYGNVSDERCKRMVCVLAHNVVVLDAWP